MRRLINYKVFEGDPNLIKEGEILVIRDPSNEKKVIDIKQRINGILTSVLIDKVSFVVNTIPTDATVVINGITSKNIVVLKGTTVSWSVSKTGFTTQTGSEIVNSNTLKNITLIAVP